EEQALLCAVIDAPQDDLPQLVYADWLEEHARPQRAELIRIQCRLADLPLDSPDYPDLLDRQQELRDWLLARDPEPPPDWPDGFNNGHDPGFLPTQLDGQFPRGFPLRFSYSLWGKWGQRPPEAIAQDLGQVARTTRRHFTLDLHRDNLASGLALLS